MKKTLLWLASGACNGESMAILGSEGYGKQSDNLPDFLNNNDVTLLWHPSLSLECPRELFNIIKKIEEGEVPLTFLCIEGSIIHGPNNTGMMDTLEGIPKRDIIKNLCDYAQVVFAMGTCAGFGGIPAAPPNPSESSGLQFDVNKSGGLLGADWRSTIGLPVVNVSGCAVTSSTMISTMQWILDGNPLELDKYHRPFTVTPCLAEHFDKTCLTSKKAGYRCYGCTTPKFPMCRSLFSPEEIIIREKPFDFSHAKTFVNYFSPQDEDVASQDYEKIAEQL